MWTDNGCRAIKKMEHCWNDNDRVNSNFWEINLSQGHLVISKPTWIGVRQKPGLRSDKPANNRLSDGMVGYSVKSRLTYHYEAQLDYMQFSPVSHHFLFS
jgi:hypothetical protein